MKSPSTKLQSLLATIAVVVAISPLTPLRAQQPFTYELAPATFTMALTIKETAPGTFQRNEIGGSFVTENRQRIPAYYNEWITGRVIEGDIPLPATDNYEYITKVVTTRYGNRELIQELVANEDLPGPAAGWSLVYVYQIPEMDEEPPAPVLTAIKRGMDPVELNIISVEPSGGGVNLDNYFDSTAYTYNREGERTRTVATLRGRFSYENPVSIDFNAPSTTAQANALQVASYAYYTDYPNSADRSWDGLVAIVVPGAIQYSNMVGSVAPSGDGDENDDPEFGTPIFTGTASVGASRVIKKRAP